MSGDASDPSEPDGAADREPAGADHEEGQPGAARHPLRVEELHVRRAPGFEAEELHLESLSPGLTVVHGPNASGKTTAARAIQWSLWPDAAPERAEVVGRFALEGSDWRVHVDRGRASYQRDGRDASAPGLPSRDQRDRYRLALHDLLQRDVRDADFAAAIERESAGGYDLDAAHDALDFDDSPATRGKQEVQRAEAAIGEWHDAQAELRELESEQDRLPELERELEAAREAGQRVDLLEQAIDYARARDDLAAADERLETFPDELERLDGDELEAVEELEAEIEAAEATLAQAETDRRAAEQELADVSLPDDGLDAGLLDRLHQRLDRLDTLEERRRQFEANLERAREQRESARQNVPLNVEADALADLDPDTWPDLAAFARTAQAVAAERRLERTVERWLGTEQRPNADRATLERGRQALEQWLANPPPDAGEGSADDGATDGTDGAGTAEQTDPAARIGAVAAAVLGVVGVVLAFVHPALLAIALVGAGLLWYGRRVASRAEDDGDAVDPRATYRESYEQLDLDQPAAWTEDAVRERLTDCYDALAEHRIDRQRANHRETLLEEHQSLAERERDLEARREQLRADLGTAPDATDLEVVATAETLVRWQACDEELRGLREEVDAVATQIDEERAALADDIVPYGYDAVADAATATECVRDLEDRASRHADAVEQRERARATIEETEAELEDLRAEREATFADVGLEPGERDRLRELCDRVDAHEEALAAKRDAATLAENERAALRELPGHEPALEDRSIADLREERDRAAETADRYDELRDRKKEIETRIGDAKGGARVESARADAERALDDLEERLADDAAAMVGDVLVDHLRDETVAASRPAVFERARDLLARITRGRYRLDLADDGGSFRAYDAAKERGFALEELSSGTQLQVLLAVRVAFVEHQERGHQLPLLLDETLANSDDDTASVIVDAVIELARAGRQVLYFTAQGDEVAKWRHALAEVDDVEYAEVDLAERRGLDERVRVPDLEDAVGRPSSPPDPDGHDHASYGDAIGVPPFDPRLGAGRAHCWYLVDDLDVLADLLELGVERWGQLETLLDRGLGDILRDDPAVRADLERSGRALETFVDCWQRGRGERVTRAVLEETDAVTETFIDDVTELARSVDGDASRILQGLRDDAVARFRSSKIEELEAFFEANGYLDPVEPLDAREIRVRVIATLVETGLDRDEAAETADALLSRLDRQENAG